MTLPKLPANRTYRQSIAALPAGHGHARRPRASVSGAEFRQALGRLAAGTSIVTTFDQEGQKLGLTATAVTALSLDPPLVLVCVDHRAKVLEHLRRSEHLAINVLSEGQHEVSAHFARRGQNRFDGVDWYAGHEGVPLIPGVLASLECRMHRLVDAGDHAILIAEVLGVKHRDGRPLVYYGSGYHKLHGVNGG